MNKKEAIAYAQFTLDYMQSSKYTGEITPENLGIEMQEAFKMYPKSVILQIVSTKKDVV